MKKIFIYYSLSGNGNVVADYLSNRGIDIRKVEIDDRNILPKNTFLRMMVGGFKALINYRDKLINFDDDIDNYDEIIIGSPIWNARLSSPINGVLNRINIKNKKVTFILYSGSGKSLRATERINKKYPGVKIINLCEPKKNVFEVKKLENI